MEAKQRQVPSSHSPGYNAILLAGPRLKPLQQVHSRIVVTGLGRSRSLITKLLSFAYAAASPISYTRRLFLSITKPDTFLFHLLITLSSKFGFSLESLLYHRRMILANILPSNYTFSAVIKSCSELRAFNTGKIVHCNVLICGYGSDSYVQAALFVEESRQLDNLPSEIDQHTRQFDKNKIRNGIVNGCIVTMSAFEEHEMRSRVGLFSTPRKDSYYCNRKMVLNRSGLYRRVPHSLPCT
ncbi:putative pentatricopeptide repeat-containing protein [Corchorus capsularis]|uniref:Putative pentatricopeptide repeat-containing protein n=1 Tax=Corchorus capsularis TaxID=210143 RepID=A0A1R3I1F9_COCAP|nr:putative pentatricopeptide repeat-containing protein [Corchorus capsularis]